MVQETIISQICIFHREFFRDIYGQKRFKKLQGIPMRYVPKTTKNSWAAFRTFVPTALSG